MRSFICGLFVLSLITMPAFADEIRRAVPDETEQAQARENALSPYKNQLADVKRTSQAAIARVLYNDGARSSDDVQAYVLLCESRDAAARGTDTDAGERACAELSRRFEMSRDAARVGFFRAGADCVIGEREQNDYFSRLLAAIDDAARDDEFDAAREMIKLAVANASSVNRDNVVRAMRRRSDALEVQFQAYSNLKIARATLRRHPDDAKANVAFGSYTCFVKGDWPAGLAMLLKGDDARLQTLARRDLQEPRDPQAQLAIADDWYEFAQQISAGGESLQIQRRAHDWYSRAFPNIGNANQRKHIADRLSALAPAAPPGWADLAEMWRWIDESIAERRCRATRLAGGAFATESFQDLAPGGTGLLIGFRLSYANNGRVLKYVQPIYRTPNGQVVGGEYGKIYGEVLTVIAPDGYAVGAAQIQGGAGLNAIGVSFMRIRGNRLDPTDMRKTELVGEGGGAPLTFNGGGIPVVGICGASSRDREWVGLGLIFGEAPPEK